jgi:hypothetical protein
MAEPADTQASSLRELAQTLAGGNRASDALSSIADHLGLVRERRFDELELRVAQLEHRIRLLEQAADARRDGP